MTSEPIVPGFHPDPSICRVGGEYWLVNSTFEYLPGVPVRHSNDLLHWELVGTVYDRPEQIGYPSSRGSGGIFAPCIRHHEGVFFLVTTNIHDIERGQMIVHATNPAGPWSQPVFVAGTPGIDPDLFWDADGTCWLTWTGGFGGDTPIHQLAIDPMTGERLGEVRQGWHGTGLASPEGPHVYRRGDWYYLLLAEGGTERGHAVTISRARSVSGPWEANPANPILSHRSTTQPVQNTGHADLVELADGSWAIVFLGVRPQGPTPGFHLLGRETFLAGIDWVDDWPVVVEGRFSSAGGRSAHETDFSQPLDAHWVGAGRHPSQFTHRVDGGLAIRPPERDEDRSLVCVRVDAFDWQATAELDRGRLTLRLDDEHWAAVERSDGQLRARLRVGPLDQVLGSTDDAPGTLLAIRAQLPEGQWPTEADVVSLGVVRDDGFTELARFDGRYLSTEVAGNFTGRMVGIEAPHGQAGPTTVRSFRCGVQPPPAA